MTMKRPTAAELASASNQRIWRSVVVAGAMLGGAAGCGGASHAQPMAPAAATPSAEPTATEAAPTAPTATDTPAPSDDASMNADPCAAPMAPAADAAAPTPEPTADTTTAPATPTKPPARPRNSGGTSTRPVGRGFVLA